MSKALNKNLMGGGGASTQSNSIDSKASVLSGYSLSTSAQTIVSAINEIEGKLSYVIDLNILTGIDPNTALNSPLIKEHIISGATVEEAIGGFDGLVNAVSKNIPIIGRLQISQYDSIQITNYIKISASTFLSGGSLTVLLVASVNQIYQDSERSSKILKYSFILHISMTNGSVTSMSLPLTEPLISFPDSSQSFMLNSTIIIGQDSVETILYKVSAGVPYVYIDGPSSWDETLYSPATQEQFEEWFNNYCRSGLYKLDAIMSGTYRTTGGTTGETYSLAISSSLFEKQEGPKVVGLEEPIRPLIYLSGNIDFMTDENGIWVYDFSSWKMKSFEISTSPIENVADYGTRGVVLGYTNLNKANGRGSIAEGFGTETSGAYSHAEGNKTQTFSTGEHAEGSFNLSNNGFTIHSVGIGSSPEDRKNAHEIMTNGDQFVYGLGGYDGTNATADTAQTLQEVINSKQATITAGTGLEFEGNTLNVTLDTTVFKVVSALPDSPAQGDENKIHLVPAESTGANNAYTEYVWINSTWEILGEYTSEVDLTPYLKTVDAESTYLKITDAESSYQKITDDALNTTSKTIVGAINEILPKVTGVGKVDPNSNGTGEVFNVYEGSGATVASGKYSHAEGYRTKATGSYSHAEGSVTTASGSNSHAEGCHTTASGYYSHAEGDETKAIGHRSHAEGVDTTASGIYSHAEGYGTNTTGEGSHAEGSHTTAVGDFSHAEGVDTNADGYGAHAEGYSTQTFSSGEHAEGYYNKSYDSGDVLVSVIHSVGIGSRENDRKNAHEIKLNGDHYIYGLGGYDGTNSDTAQTLQTVINGLQASIRTRQSEQTVYTEVPKLTADYQIPANDTFVERVYIIPVGDTLYSVTGDSSILWAGGIAPNPSANSVLVVSIVKNLATWNVFMPI